MILPDASRSQEAFDVAPGASHRQTLPDCGLYVLWYGTYIVAHIEVSENLFMGGYNPADGSGESHATEQDSKGKAFQSAASLPKLVFDPPEALFSKLGSPKGA